MARLNNIPPGEIFREEFLIPFAITAYRLLKDMDIPQTRVSEIIKGNRRFLLIPLYGSANNNIFLTQ